MLFINNITKSFDDLKILDNISLKIHQGQLVHISGDNGSGKSTLFKIITGLLQTDEGNIEIDESNVIGALIENPGFLEYETAIINLKFLSDLNNNFDQNKIFKLMNNFSLDPYNKQPISKYSIGMRQKVGIIQAVMEDQDIILLDEPTRGLDDNGVSQFINLIKLLIEENKLVIIASHDKLMELEYDMSLYLKNGKLTDE